ncbi:MAG: hypothetical protein Q4A07_10945, partial [Coriobacteriales bacterium]|nr:hypothetical protein [Coriobacteriales bacterium]
RDYTFTYKSNVKAGKATVTATGKGNYAGSQSVKFKIVAPSASLRAQVQTYGWEKGWKANGTLSGTTGQGKRLEAVQIRLTGNMAKKYDVYYRVHAQKYGWMGWARNGASAGTAGHAICLEAIQVVIVPKGAKAPSATYKGVKQAYAKAFVGK